MRCVLPGIFYNLYIPNPHRSARRKDFISKNRKGNMRPSTRHGRDYGSAFYVPLNPIPETLTSSIPSRLCGFAGFGKTRCPAGCRRGQSAQPSSGPAKKHGGTGRRGCRIKVLFRIQGCWCKGQLVSPPSPHVWGFRMGIVRHDFWGPKP